MTLYSSAQRRFRLIHRTLAPIVVAPIMLTLLSGVLYQIALLTGKGSDYSWLLAAHVGHFGWLNLDQIYPFINAFCLLFMVGSGLSMWIQIQRHRH